MMLDEINKGVQLINWPPKYIIKKHKRARNVKMRAIDSECLQITVPYRFSIKEIPSILEFHKSWIIKQLTKLQAQDAKRDELPNKISFPLLNVDWLVTYIETIKKPQIIERPHREMVIVGNLKDKSLIKKLLVNWIKEFSKNHLAARLHLISQKIQLPFDGTNVRDQKTIWGSCTSQKSISLNYKLIFLPNDLVNYVIIHELCHTVHLNHSIRFWKLVEQFDADWRVHRHELRRGDKYIPAWVL